MTGLWHARTAGAGGHSSEGGGMELGGRVEGRMEVGAIGAGCLSMGWTGTCTVVEGNASVVMVAF